MTVREKQNSMHCFGFPCHASSPRRFSAADLGPRSLWGFALLWGFAGGLPLADCHGQATAPEAASSSTSSVLLEAARSNPAVAIALELPRETASQRLRVISTLVDLGALPAASQLVPELAAAELDSSARAELVREFGSGRFLQLIRLEQSPDSGANFAGAARFAQDCLDAAAREARNPQRIAALLEQLHSPTPQERLAARVDLRAGGTPAVVALLTALAQEAAPDKRIPLMEALLEMKPDVVEPLIAVLADGRGHLRRDAAEIAGHLRIHRALPWLTTLAAQPAEVPASAAAASALQKYGLRVPTPAEAQALLNRELEAVRRGMPATALDTLLPDGSDGATWWEWKSGAQPSEGEFQSQVVTADELSVLAAARLIRLLDELQVQDRVTRRQSLLYGLQEAAILGSEPSASVTRRLADATLDELSATLAEATHREYSSAAVRLIEALGQRGDSSALRTPDGLPSPLAAAAAHHDRPVRFAALQAIMTLAPRESFAGSSEVVESLWQFAFGAGPPVAVVGAPVASRATSWAGELRGLRFESRPAVTVRDVLLAVRELPIQARVELVLVDSELSAPGVNEVVYQLRSFRPTRGVPVVILCRSSQLARMNALAEHDRLTVATSRPVGPQAMQRVVERAFAATRVERRALEAAQEEARQALGWLAELSASPGPYDELLRHADELNLASVPTELIEPTIDLLGALSTGGSQQLLVDLASQSSLPIEQRARAAQAFANSVAKVGLQLTQTALLEQYDRYNSSESADPQTRGVLSQILDVVEGK
jgi:hypothetical protein